MACCTDAAFQSATDRAAGVAMPVNNAGQMGGQPRAAQHSPAQHAERGPAQFGAAQRSRSTTHPTPRSASVSTMPATCGPMPVTWAAARLSSTSAAGMERAGAGTAQPGQASRQRGKQGKHTCSCAAAVPKQRWHRHHISLLHARHHNTQSHTRTQADPSRPKAASPARSLLVSTSGRIGGSPWRARCAFCSARAAGRGTRAAPRQQRLTARRSRRSATHSAPQLPLS